MSPNEYTEMYEVLSNLQLNKKEQDIYLFLLTHPVSSLTNIARANNLAISTVQSILKRLHEKKFVFITKQKSVHTYSAENPEKIKKLMQHTMQEFEAIIPLLQSMQKNESTNTKISVFYKQRVTDIFNAAIASKEKCVYEIVSAKDIQQLLGEKYHFTRRRLEHNVFLKSLRVQAHEIKKYNREIHRHELREAKFLPKEIEFEATIFFWDDTIALFSTKHEGIAIMIESNSMRIMMKQIFDALWSISKPMETI